MRAPPSNNHTRWRLHQVSFLPFSFLTLVGSPPASRQKSRQKSRAQNRESTSSSKDKDRDAKEREKELAREVERERERQREKEIMAFREFSTKLPMRRRRNPDDPLPDPLQHSSLTPLHYDPSGSSPYNDSQNNYLRRQVPPLDHQLSSGSGGGGSSRNEAKSREAQRLRAMAPAANISTAEGFGGNFGMNPSTMTSQGRNLPPTDPNSYSSSNYMAQPKYSQQPSPSSGLAGHGFSIMSSMPENLHNPKALPHINPTYQQQQHQHQYDSHESESKLPPTTNYSSSQAAAAAAQRRSLNDHPSGSNDETNPLSYATGNNRAQVMISPRIPLLPS